MFVATVCTDEIMKFANGGYWRDFCYLPESFVILNDIERSHHLFHGVFSSCLDNNVNGCMSGVYMFCSFMPLGIRTLIP